MFACKPQSLTGQTLPNRLNSLIQCHLRRFPILSIVIDLPVRVAAVARQRIMLPVRRQRRRRLAIRILVIVVRQQGEVRAKEVVEFGEILRVVAINALHQIRDVSAAGSVNVKEERRTGLARCLLTQRGEVDHGDVPFTGIVLRVFGMDEVAEK